MKKTMIVSAVLALTAAPALAFAGPSVGISYTDMGLSGHAGRPGISLNAGNIDAGGVVTDGSVSIARSYYNVNASIGKLIPADGLSFEPYLAAGFLNLNYNQQEIGYTSQTISDFGGSYTYQTPYSYSQRQSIQDFYGLAGVNLSVPLSREVAFGLGGGYGHTLGTYGDGSGGAVYTGDAIASFQIAPRVTTDLQISYLHVPGASMTNYGAGINYHF